MSRDPRDSYDDSERRNGHSSSNGNGPSSRAGRPSDPGTGRRTPPNGLIKPPLPSAGGRAPSSSPSSSPSGPRGGRRTSGENYTLARMHAPRGGRPDRPEHDERSDSDERGGREERGGPAGRGGRSVGAMARDLSRSMSRSIQALGHSFGRAIRDAGTFEPHGVRPTPLPPELMQELAQAQPYRRSRARVVARKWRLARVGPNPIAYAVVVMLLLVAVVGVLGVGGAGGVYALTYYQAHQSQIEQIYDLRFTQGVQILDRNGKTLYVARSDDNGINIYTPLEQINQKMQKATVDTEDATFWTNQGVDLYRTIGALLADAKSGGASQGASTITQQVIKNIVAKDGSKTVQRKLNEAILAYGLTLNYTKAQILEMYLNTIDYGDQNTGIEAAARNYFGLEPIPDPNNPKQQIMANQQLDWWQAAILAGLPNAPSYYLPIQYSCDKAPCEDTQWANPCMGNPHDAVCVPNPKYDSTVGTGDGHEWLVYRRTLIVLGNLYRYGDINLDQENTAIQKMHDCLVNECMGHWLGYQNTSANSSNGTNTSSSDQNVVPELAPWFVDYVIKELAQDFGVTDPQHTALKVYTTLDYNLQAYAEHTVTYYVKDQHTIRWPLYAPKGCTQCLQPSLGDYANGHDGATVAIDPHTGDILAMVGSSDYTDQSKQVAGQVNIVTAKRSMGSATKGVVYATAFQKGWNPGIMLQDKPICWPDPALVSDPGKPDDGQPIQDNDAPACVGYYAPHNFDPESFSGNATIRVVLANSLNIPATEAMSFVGATAVTSQDFISMASRMGIDTLTPGRMGVSTALGTQEIPLLELTSAYGTFAAQGKHAPVRSILRIEGPDGTALYQAPTPDLEQVISPQAAYMITSVLSDNEAREADFNVTNPLTNTSWAFAAKTGTSQGTTGPKDIITVGYSPYLVVGAWVGNADGEDLKSNIIGISGAGYIFSDMIQWGHDNYHWPDVQFPIPPDLARGSFNCVTGLAPYTNQPSGPCQLQVYKPGSTPLYFGYTHDYSGLHPDEDWYVQGQEWVQS